LNVDNYLMATAKIIEAYMADDSVTPADKRKALIDLAHQLVAANAEAKRSAAELDIAAEKKTQESQKCRRQINRHG
jgi:hypothetical protein